MRSSMDDSQIELEMPVSEASRPTGKLEQELPFRLKRVVEDMELYAMKNRKPGSPVTVKFPEDLSEMEKRAVFERLSAKWPVASRHRVGSGEVVVLGDTVPGNRD